MTYQGCENNKLTEFNQQKLTDQIRPRECSKKFMQTDTKNMSQQNLYVDLFDIPAEIDLPENDLDPQGTFEHKFLKHVESMIFLIS